VAALVNVALFVVVVLPLGRSVAAAETAAADATRQLALARQQERQARNAASSQERADRELRRFYAEVLPDSFPVASRATNRWLQQAARDAGLEYRGATFNWEALRESTLSRAYSTATLRGRYANIRQFLHAVETATEFLVVESVELAQATTPGASGLLEVRVVVSTYFSNGPGQ
jgi:Tfp pilus assembly protein PilO